MWVSVSCLNVLEMTKESRQTVGVISRVPMELRIGSKSLRRW